MTPKAAIMMKRPNIPLIILWLWVLAVTILIGGGIFEHLVLTPLWAGSPPESVTAWPHGVVQARFFGVVSPLCFLLSLALIIASWWMPRRQRKWALVAGLSMLLLGVATVSFFLPILQQTQATRGAGLSGEEITRLVNQFKTWNWVRWILGVSGWAVEWRALSLSASGESH
jgi:hypothetical protein